MVPQARDGDVDPRIQCRTWKSEPLGGPIGGPRRSRVGRLCAVFWTQAGDGHWHADPRSVAARESGRRACATWFGDGTNDGVGCGRKPGSACDQRKYRLGAATVEV